MATCCQCQNEFEMSLEWITVDYQKLQGVQDQKCQKEMAISLEGSTFHTTLVKPKCVWKLCISYAKS